MRSSGRDQAGDHASASLLGSDGVDGNFDSMGAAGHGRRPLEGSQGDRGAEPNPVE